MVLTVDGIFSTLENLILPSFVINSFSISITAKNLLFFEVFITTSWLSIFKFKEMQETKLLLLVSCQQKQLLL